jgi:hypothetical protein
MPEYVRVAEFEVDEAGLDAMVSGISAESGPPEGVPGKAITVLADRSAGKVRIAVRFGSEEDLRTGSAALDAMSPPPGANVRRVSVEEFEVVLEREAP